MFGRRKRKLSLKFIDLIFSILSSLLKLVFTGLYIVLKFIFKPFNSFANRQYLRNIKGKDQNEEGYVFRKTAQREKVYEHREIAESILGRKLTQYEVVHHINGVTYDNELSNLCVMDSIEHDRFHKWCKFIHSKFHRYPKRETQLKKLREFRGIILSEFNSKSDAI